MKNMLLSAGDSGNNAAPNENANNGTLILAATCVPENTRYPQNISLLNGAGKSWKQSFTFFVIHMACHCQDVTADVPEKIIMEGMRIIL